MLLYQSAFLWALYITFHLLKDGFFMDYIKYKTTLKASGVKYKKIVFWNRFVRNPVETILTWTPASHNNCSYCTGISQYVPGSYICGMLGIPDLYIFLPVQKQC